MAIEPAAAVCFRSGALEVHVEAGGDAPISVGVGVWAAGKGDRPDLRATEGVSKGARRSVAGL